MKLKHGQFCPIHRRRDCCGRSEFTRYERKKHSKWEQVRPGVRRIRDQYADHPDGYRYKLSGAEMNKVLTRKVQEQNGRCFYCNEEFDDCRGVTPDHRNPKGMGGARADDREENIVAACAGCNSLKGSTRIPHDNRSNASRDGSFTGIPERSTTNPPAQPGVQGSNGREEFQRR